MASDGYNTTESKSVLNMAISSKPICEAPSSPMLTPACEPTNLMLDLAYCDILIWSKALEKNAAKVETKGIFPRREKPKAAPTIFCSAIYISKNLSGWVFFTVSEYVELLTSASSTTALGKLSTMLAKILP